MGSSEFQHTQSPRNFDELQLVFDQYFATHNDVDWSKINKFQYTPMHLFVKYRVRKVKNFESAILTVALCSTTINDPVFLFEQKDKDYFGNIQIDMAQILYSKYKSLKADNSYKLK